MEQKAYLESFRPLTLTMALSFQEPAGRQRRRRELLFLAMLWPVLILVPWPCVKTKGPFRELWHVYKEKLTVWQCPQLRHVLIVG